MHDTFLAIDLGAESGRVIAVQLDQDRVSLVEIHRFSNQPVGLPSGLHWDIASLWREIVGGLSKAAVWAQANRARLLSVGVDAWGVDWALLTGRGELVGLPHAYRDERNPAACAQALHLVSPERIYALTGIQLMPINTIFSLYAQRMADASLFQSAARLVFIPDLFHFWLSGRVAVEATIASTSQLVDLQSRAWSQELIDVLGLPGSIFSETTNPGTVLGPIRADLAAATGLPADLQVVLPGSHDTASAVAAVPASDRSSWCYLSSGTWSLLGAELDVPCTSDAARTAMFTNELGVGNKIRFLKNIAGLWLVQELKRDLAKSGQEFDYPRLTQLAEQAASFSGTFDANHPSLQIPGGIRHKIAALCREAHQPIPQTPGEFTRCCLVSLAAAYRLVFERLRQVLERDFEVVHIVGGGGQNQLLCQMTADALQRKVVVGPLEATAIGNGLTQAMALGRLADLGAIRTLVAMSVRLETYLPRRASRPSGV